jgi:hypothetical protein
LKCTKIKKYGKKKENNTQKNERNLNMNILTVETREAKKDICDVACFISYCDYRC